MGDDTPSLGSEQLATALEAQDVAAVAFALRNDHVVVPMLPVDGPPQVRVFRRGDADRYMLLLFSSTDTYRQMVPEEDDHRVLGYDAAALREFLTENIGVLESVWFDVAGPHAMQAAPQDVLDALQLDTH
ncbi:ketosteroid isomerase-like protein [Salinibacterium sp. CAN_S4]|uniref:SseB family protein n=1 Tax=Salinibacterium sp. CAN_S4 TaxID=2787727 RepID=UPI0018F00CE4